MNQIAKFVPPGMIIEDPKTQLSRLKCAFKDMDFAWEHAESLKEMYQEYRRLRQEFNHYMRLEVGDESS